MKYRVTIRGQKGDYQVPIECDRIVFKNSWWAVFWRDGYLQRATGERVKPGEIVMTQEIVVTVEPVLLAAVPAEHINLIEKIEEA